MTVRELLARIDSRELTEWAAFERLYGPLGPVRHDYLTAMVAGEMPDWKAPGEVLDGDDS
jgi:hypothetical protein